MRNLKKCFICSDLPNNMKNFKNEGISLGLSFNENIDEKFTLFSFHHYFYYMTKLSGPKLI